MYKLERYKGTRSRYTCPSCNKKQVFTRYINESGDYLDVTVGRCNRESNCGYHLTPKEYLPARAPRSTYERVNAVNRNERLNPLNGVNIVNRNERLNTVNTLNGVNRLNWPNKLNAETIDTIDNSLLVRSLENTKENRFLKFLLSFADAPAVERVCRKYFIGTTRDGRTVFWLIDRDGRARTGKIISYKEETGKRDKAVNPSWAHYELKRAGILPRTFESKICMFGEHLLNKERSKPVGIVEAEKTAVIASLFIDTMVWIAAGAKSYLKAEKLRAIKNRRIVLYPDADAFEQWSREAEEARDLGLDVGVSDVIERRATDEQRQSGYDLADYLIESEIEMQSYNLWVDEFERKRTKILESPALMDWYDDLYNERLALMETESLDENEMRRIVEFVACHAN